MEDNLKLAKQKYLTEEIFEKNYSLESFLTYLSQIKEDIDLDDFSIEELKVFVKNFKENQPLLTDNGNNNENFNIRSDETPDYPKFEEINIVNNDQVTPFPKNNIPQNNNVALNEEVVDCLKCETTPLSSLIGKIKITISSPEIVESGIFSSNYVTYHVQTLPNNYNVRRRFSDFEWLHQILTTLFPNYPIVDFPKKKFSKRFDEEYIKKRMRFLNRFIESISNIDVILSSQVLFDFLSIENNKKLEIQKKIYSKMETPCELHLLKSISGKLKIKLNCDEKNYTNIKNFIRDSDSLNKKLNNQLKSLKKEMEAVTNRLNEVSKIFGQIYETSLKSHSDDPLTIKTYKMLNLLVKGWGDSNKRNSDFISAEIKEFFSFNHKQMSKFKDLEQVIERAKQDFYSDNKRLIIKKEELWKNINPTNFMQDWELENQNKNKYDFNQLSQNKFLSFQLMLPKETQISKKLRQRYFYNLDNFTSFYYTISNFKGEKFKSHFIELSDKHSKILTESHTKWADLLSIYIDGYIKK